jgi:signal transduction histidine kinase
LNNVAKHSRAKNVKVVLVHRFRRLVLKIKDDGKGFSRENLPTSPETSHGMGIRGMQERAQLFGGTFDLDSRPGRGTSIRVAWRMDGH